MADNNSIMMTMNRNVTITSTLGHMITFKKGVPTGVPSIMVRTCAERGAEKSDGENVLLEAEEVKETQPVDPGQRLEDIRAAMEKIVERNDVNDFTAAGIPSVPAVNKEVGYRVDRTEVNSAWRQRAEDLADDAE